MNDEHVPAAEFVSRLEWEIGTAMRRPTGLNGESRFMRLARGRWGAALALVVVSMFVGGAGTYAAIHRIDEQAAALYVARAEVLLDIARARLEPASQQLASTADMVKQGVAPQSELLAAQAAVVQTQSEVTIHELRLAETQQTGQPPNDALSAPRVHGRDFVTERMVARRQPLEQRLALANEQLKRSKKLNDAGIVPKEELRAAQSGVAGAAAELSALNERIALRASFLEGKLSAAEVELQGMREAAVAQREAAARQLQDVGVRQKRIAEMVESGLAPTSDLSAANAELRTAQGRVELADLELRILDEKVEQAKDQ